MFTKQQVQTMKEDELRETVLLPLMRAMKFRDVYKYHGGVNEKGKDIVCWYKHPFLGNRRNVALVVKVRPISGKAAIDEATAGEITMQINQCFGKPYDDPITGEEQSVHECWVVSNKPIGKDAIGAITAGLGKSVSTVQYVDIDTLWELIEKHLPLQAAFQKLAEAQQEFEQLDPQYRLDAHLTGCAGYLGHLFIDRDVREHDLARITHRLHTEMPLPRKWRTSKLMFTEYAWRPLGNQAEGWRVLFVRKRKWGRECTTALSP